MDLKTQLARKNINRSRISALLPFVFILKNRYYLSTDICTEITASRIASTKLFSSSGKVLSEEEKAAENVFIKKLELEKLEKLARKEIMASRIAPRFSSRRLFSSSGKLLSEEEKADENVFIKGPKPEEGSATNANRSSSSSSSSEGSSNEFRDFAWAVIRFTGLLGVYY